MLSKPIIQNILNLNQAMLRLLHFKGRKYGPSWKQRGGVGAFMMMARKWDRIENICKANGYDVFNPGAKDMLEDVADLKAYLTLIESHLLEDKEHPYGGEPYLVPPEDAQLADQEIQEVADSMACGPGTGYVNQDGNGV